jgi:hypothetical protein
MKLHKDLTPEGIVLRTERTRRFETELFGMLAGAAGGAGGGALIGPPGIAFGAILGAAVGALASFETEIVEHEKAEHEKELDAIGLEPIPQPSH